MSVCIDEQRLGQAANVTMNCLRKSPKVIDVDPKVA